MKLFVSGASPYVRKVRVHVHERGLADRLAQIDVTGLSPVAQVAELSAQNPLGKVPALIVDDTTTLFDSRVIAEYLDTVGDGPKLFPEVGPARFTALRRVALADGICDAAILGRYEKVLRPEAKRWPAFLEAQLDKVRRAVAALADEGLSDDVDAGTLAAAVALAYLDLRWAEEDLWRSAHPQLADWHARFAERPSMRATEPRV